MCLAFVKKEVNKIFFFTAKKKNHQSLAFSKMRDIGTFFFTLIKKTYADIACSQMSILVFWSF